MIKIGIDLMGNERSPYAEIEAIKLFFKRTESLNTCLYCFVTEEQRKNIDFIHPNVKYVTCKEYITHKDIPFQAIRYKKESTLLVAIKYLRDGKISALISSANTGAYVLACLLYLKQIDKRVKPSLFSFFNAIKLDRKVLVGDLGAIVDVKPNDLLNIAKIGCEIYKNLYNSQHPKVFLLNIGSEEGKGDYLRKEAYKLLSSSNINFLGNIEAKYIMNSKADIIVTDGFTGNIVLKSYEGAISCYSKILKKAISDDLVAKFFSLPLLSKLRIVKKKFSSESVGCALLTGFNGTVVKTHGNATDYEIYKSICVVRQMIKLNLNMKVINNFYNSNGDNNATEKIYR